MKLIINLILVIIFSNCGIYQAFQKKNLGNLNIINQKDAQIESLTRYQVTGQHCKYMNFYSAPYPGIDYAFKDALKKAPPKTTGLKDVQISIYSESGWSLLGYFIIPHFLGAPFYRACYNVTGTPARGPKT